jgi:glycosyltransferase involved in cell wall biosynthesis
MVVTVPRPLAVGLNLVYLVPGDTGGMETYACELISSLISELSDLRLVAFVNKELSESGGGPWHDLIESITVPVSARRRAEWVRGEQQLLPGLAARAGVDILHSLGSTSPAWGRYRRVVTIHDVIYRMFPETHFGLKSLGMRMLVPLAARCSHRIIVPSASTRDDLVHHLRVSPEKIDVIPMGVGAPPPNNRWAGGDLRGRLRLGPRAVVLTVSAKRPHKNLARLLDALALIPSDRRPILLLPGYPTPHEEELKRRASVLGIQDDTRFMGWVSDDELEELYSAADCFVFPSLYEGFGLPVLEAMARGVPVACSDRGSLAEVAGVAAQLFDPESPRSIATAIEGLLQDTENAERLRKAGLERARGFEWRETSRATLACYERALGSA